MWEFPEHSALLLPIKGSPNAFIYKFTHPWKFPKVWKLKHFPQKGPLYKSKQNSNFNLDLISNSSNSLLDFKFPKSQKRNKNKNRKYEKIAKKCIVTLVFDLVLFDFLLVWLLEFLDRAGLVLSSSGLSKVGFVWVWCLLSISGCLLSLLVCCGAVLVNPSVLFDIWTTALLSGLKLLCCCWKFSIVAAAANFSSSCCILIPRYLARLWMTFVISSLI